MQFNISNDSSTSSTFDVDTIRNKNSPLGNDTILLQGLLSLSTTALIVDIVSCGIQPFISLLGILGNSLCLIVILYQGFQQTTNIILFGLALTDLLYVLLSFRSLVECFARQFNPQLAIDVDLFTQTTLVMLESELAALSRLYTCFIAVERFIVVQFPLKASSLLTKTRTIIISGFLWIFASQSCLICFLGLEVKEINSPVNNTTAKVLAFTELFKQNAEVFSVLASLIFPLVSRYIPIVIVFVCTVIILQALRQSQSQRKKMVKTTSSANNLQQQQITNALLAVCFVFLLTNIPGIIVSLFRLVYQEEGFANVGRYKNIHKVAVSVLLLFMIFNSSVNFMLYIFFNQKFAAASRKLLSQCWRKIPTT